jgi:hypothetical protein
MTGIALIAQYALASRGQVHTEITTNTFFEYVVWSGANRAIMIKLTFILGTAASIWSFVVAETATFLFRYGWFCYSTFMRITALCGFDANSRLWRLKWSTYMLRDLNLFVILPFRPRYKVWIFYQVSFFLKPSKFFLFKPSLFACVY